MPKVPASTHDGGATRICLGAALLALGFLPVLALAAAAETVVLEASHDATLVESDDGGLANGAGPALFAGRNNSPRNSRRRTLLGFDVAAVLPAGAWVTAVELELEMTPSNRAPIDLGLYRVLRAWSEGPSSASGGGGAPAEPGDATWLHARYDTEPWAEPGGDFSPEPSAVVSVGEPGLYVWGSTAALVADVQDWLDDPARDFGWIVVGGEDRRQSAKSFASRESPVEEWRPRLVVEYETSCRTAGLRGSAYALCHAYCEALECAAPDPRGSTRACSRLAQRFARRSGGSPLPCEPSQPSPDAD